jgi:hypothetical protein
MAEEGLDPVAWSRYRLRAKFSLLLAACDWLGYSSS